MSLLVVSALFCCCTFNGFAADANSHELAYAKMSTEELAYCDLEEVADEAVRQAILDARREIIYNTSWTVDGQLALKNSDGTIKALPEFSDLFPGWEIPTITDRETNAVSMLYFSSYIIMETTSTTAAEPFAKIVPVFSTKLTIQAAVIPGSSWNCGVIDLTANTDLGYVLDLPVGQEVYVTRTFAGHQYSIRATSNGAAGYALMNVYQDASVSV